MTGKGHVVTGFIAALYPVFVYQDLGIWFVPVLCAVTVLGSLGPDWLEIPYPIKGSDGRRAYKRLIPHRTFTHVLSWWVLGGLFFYSLSIGSEVFGFASNGPEEDVMYALLASFMFGGVVHLICDLPNKRHISLLLPTDRFMLNLWKSDRNEYIFGVFVFTMVTWLTMGGIYPPDLADIN